MEEPVEKQHQWLLREDYSDALPVMQVCASSASLSLLSSISFSAYSSEDTLTWRLGAAYTRLHSLSAWHSALSLRHPCGLGQVH